MQTIKSRKEFSEAYLQGKRYSHPLVRISVLSPNKSGQTKVAFVAAKRLGNAVVRNRSKRVLRHAFQDVDQLKHGVNIILFATAKTARTSPQEVSEALNELFYKAQILK